MIWRCFGPGNLNYILTFLPHIFYRNMNILLRAKSIQEPMREKEENQLFYLAKDLILLAEGFYTALG